MEIVPLGPGLAAELRGVTLAEIAADTAAFRVPRLPAQLSLAAGGLYDYRRDLRPGSRGACLAASRKRAFVILNSRNSGMLHNAWSWAARLGRSSSLRRAATSSGIFALGSGRFLAGCSLSSASSSDCATNNG